MQQRGANNSQANFPNGLDHSFKAGNHRAGTLHEQQLATAERGVHDAREEALTAKGVGIERFFKLTAANRELARVRAGQPPEESARSLDRYPYGEDIPIHRLHK